ncbi:PD-(D/E)XK motif protein [Knoellia sp. CPCC 206450]|uniref:PD-(D/E)XK motif protein n=1 Tax=Knoellia tibetensis TaxID=3404798 RepID=UPI003B439D14
MTTGTDLALLLETVIAPADSGFNVVPIPGAENYRIGRGLNGALVLLTPADEDPEPPTRLRRLSLDPNLRCTLGVPDAAGPGEEGDFGVVQFQVDDQALVPPFLDVVAALVRLLGPDPAPGEVSSGMRRLVRLFAANAAMRGSVLGLWAEILAIVESTVPATLVDAWHAHVDARFDFSAPGSRLEVKATTRDLRVHQFSLPQLEPVAGSAVTVLSIMTTETHAGTSIGQLVARLEHLLAGDAARQMKVHEQVADVLGADWPNHLEHRFDEQQAHESALLLPAGDIPRVDAADPAILEVKLKVDCTDVEPDPAPSGLAALISSTLVAEAVAEEQT